MKGIILTSQTGRGASCHNVVKIRVHSPLYSKMKFARYGSSLANKWSAQPFSYLVVSASPKSLLGEE